MTFFRLVVPDAAHDRSADFGRPGERNLLDVGVRGDGRTRGVAVADQQVCNPVRHAGLGEDSVEDQRRERGFLGGFDDTAAARGERRRELTTEIEDRSVPGKDQPHHVVGFFEGVGVLMGVDAGEAAGIHVGGDPLDLGAPPGVVPEKLGTDGHGCLGLRRNHAGVERLELGQFCCVLIDQFADAPQHLGSLAAGQSLPDTRLGSLLRTRNGIVDRFWAAILELSDLFFGGGIENRNHLTGTGSFTDFVQQSLHRHRYPLLASLRLSCRNGFAL